MTASTLSIYSRESTVLSPKKVVAQVLTLLVLGFCLLWLTITTAQNTDNIVDYTIPSLVFLGMAVFIFVYTRHYYQFEIVLLLVCSLLGFMLSRTQEVTDYLVPLYNLVVLGGSIIITAISTLLRLYHLIDQAKTHSN